MLKYKRLINTIVCLYVYLEQHENQNKDLDWNRCKKIFIIITISLIK